MTGGNGRITPIAGRFFDDTMDGYFQLRESVRQMLVRNGFAGAWISLAHAPMMDLPGVAPDAPVPLRLRPESSGTIRRMALAAALEGETVRLRGVAAWSWFDGARDADTEFRPEWRLAEPVFFRGIGFALGEVPTEAFGTVAAGGAESAVAISRGAECQEGALGWTDVRVWGAEAAEIRRVADPSAALFRRPAEANASGERVLLNAGNPAVADAVRRLSDDW